MSYGKYCWSSFHVMQTSQRLRLCSREYRFTHAFQCMPVIKARHAINIMFWYLITTSLKVRVRKTQQTSALMSRASERRKKDNGRIISRYQVQSITGNSQCAKSTSFFINLSSTVTRRFLALRDDAKSLPKQTTHGCLCAASLKRRLTKTPSLSVLCYVI